MCGVVVRWANPTPYGKARDEVNVTVAACARKCSLTADCLAFEIYQLAPKACYIFVDELRSPFTPNPDCFACVSNHSKPRRPGGNGSHLLIDIAALGLPFLGIGGLNGGNGARLLANYPQAERDTVLDLLFSDKLSISLALQILKVELGADGFAANAVRRLIRNRSL